MTSHYVGSSRTGLRRLSVSALRSEEQAEKNAKDKFEHTLSKSAKSCLRTSETGNFKYSANSSIPILPPLEELAIEAYSSKCLRMPSQSNLNREL